MRFSAELTATAALAIAAGLGGCAKTATYGTGEAPEMAILREVTGGLGGGLIGGKKEEKPIDYQPRAPLVMPASVGQLPPPVETAEAANEQWPSDTGGETGERPDPANGRDDAGQDDYRRLKPLAGIESPGRSERRAYYRKIRDNNYKPAFDGGAQQRREFKAAIDEAEGVGRTGRRYLTDPPEALREPAPTAPQEFEQIKKKRNFFAGLFGGG